MSVSFGVIFAVVVWVALAFVFIWVAERFAGSFWGDMTVGTSLCA
jgi:hypothetical protein